MAGFDPDAYLAQKPAAAPAAFDPDAYLAAVAPMARKTGTMVDQIPGSSVRAPAATQPVGKDFTFGQKVMGAIETVPALVTSALTAPLVEGAKIGGTLTSGKFGTQAGIRAGEEAGRRMQERFYQPRTEAGQQYVGDIGNALASTGLQGVPMNVLGDLQRGMVPATRAVTDLGGAKVAQRAERLAQEASAKDWQRASEIDAGKASQQLGFAINPADSNPSLGTNLAVGAAGKSNVSIKNAKANLIRANEIAREDLGLPKNTPLTAEAFDKARSAHSAPYDNIRKIGVMQASDDVLGDLGGLKLDPLSTSSPEKAAKVNAVVDRVISQVESGLSGDNVVGQIRGFRKDATQVLKNPNASPIDIDVAETNLKIANALENLVENNISNPKALDDFRKARTAIAKTYDWETATGVTTKQVDPSQIVKLAEKGKPLSGKLAQVAEVAGNFPKDFDTSRNYMKEAFQYLRRGGVGGTIGFALGGPVGAAIGAGVTSLGGEAAARMLTRPGMQNRLAIPQDRRIPLPVEPKAPMAPIPQDRAIVPYDYSQQAFVPPNFVMQGEQYGPRVTTPGFAPGPAQLPAPSAQGTMNMLRTEDARQAVMSRTLGQQAEQQTAAAEAAARKPAGRGVELMFDAAGNLVEAPAMGAGGVIGASSALESAVSKIAGQMQAETSTKFSTRKTTEGKFVKTIDEFGDEIISRTGPKFKTTGKVTTGQSVREPSLFNLTAEERIAWDKTKANLAEIMPGMKTLDDKAVAGRLMDLEWVKQAVIKGNEKARMLDEIVARSDNARLRQDAMMKREILQGDLELLEEQFRKARPVKTGGQGPKTRAFQRNMLRPDDGDIQNALVK